MMTGDPPRACASQLPMLSTELSFIQRVNCLKRRMARKGEHGVTGGLSAAWQFHPSLWSVCRQYLCMNQKLSAAPVRLSCRSDIPHVLEAVPSDPDPYALAPSIAFNHQRKTRCETTSSILPPATSKTTTIKSSPNGADPQATRVMNGGPALVCSPETRTYDVCHTCSGRGMTHRRPLAAFFYTWTADPPLAVAKLWFPRHIYDMYLETTVCLLSAGSMILSVRIEWAFGLMSPYREV
ncbi:hypothetical protein LX32DRAFT_171018 [Colletotrichum zoysiae]|uniref:Uncharacterized protein n=1 Tax=Colletotrichum zoysiae TaxID=1216348 RepID=A0AAD9H641_9PEZI|nr:hypothetical protein LX32DRAFT_171018 [Colletotrichum zoysiae]